LSTTEDNSAFASFAFDFTPQLTLNAEGRYLEETLVAYNRTATSETPLDRSTFHKFVPRVSLQYKPNADMMAYATYSRGINRGGFNLTVLSLTASQRAYLNNLQQVSDVYKPATLDNFELGLKGQLFNHRLTYSLAGFYAKWYDQAFSQNLPVPIDPVNAPTGPSTIVSTTGNSAQSTVRGFELEGGLRASRHLSFTYNVAYSKVTLDHSVQCVQCASITGNTTLPKGATNPAAPSFTAAVGGEYSDDLTGDYKWYVGGDYVHRGRIFTSYENISWIGASDKVNLRAGIRSERIEAMIYVNNVFNNQAYSSVSLNSSLLGGNSVLLGLPVLRTFGAKIGYHF
ncbi:MAG TPA: TonB-dependent receptor, partial [Novosphingobium sp.]|nr:TonB-dependent receptor [Novosphingobium sp.]